VLCYEPDLRELVKVFMRGSGNKGSKDCAASPLGRLVFEKILFPHNEDRLFGGASFMAFLENGCRELYPHAINSHIIDHDFISFVMKYALVSRQMLFSGLKNPARQRRSVLRHFDDLNILMSEANYTDDLILQKTKQNPNSINTVALNMSLGLVSRSMSGYLQTGFALEIYGLHELPMVFA